MLDSSIASKIRHIICLKINHELPVKQKKFVRIFHQLGIGIEYSLLPRVGHIETRFMYHNNYYKDSRKTYLNQ